MRQHHTISSGETANRSLRVYMSAKIRSLRRKGRTRTGFFPRLYLQTGLHLPRGAAKGTEFQLPPITRNVPRISDAVPEPGHSSRRFGPSHG